MGQDPESNLNEVVPGHNAKEGEVEFVIPTNIPTAGLQMGDDVGKGKPAITIHLQHPK